MLTGYCLLKDHLKKMGTADQNRCEFCEHGTETAWHILSECEALDRHGFQYII